MFRRARFGVDDVRVDRVDHSSVAPRLRFVFDGFAHHVVAVQHFEPHVFRSTTLDHHAPRAQSKNHKQCKRYILATRLYLLSAL